MIHDNFTSLQSLYLFKSSPEVVHLMLNTFRMTDLFPREKGSLELTVPEFVADVSSVFCPSSSRLQLEI